MSCLLVVACSTATLAAVGSSTAATSGTVVGATVPSATNVSIAACLPGTPSTNIGSLLPGSNSVTTAPCSVTFGSSNNTASLRLRQADGWGSAMFRPTIGGALDPAFNAGVGYRQTNVEVGDNAYSAVVQPDGKLLVAGQTVGSDNDVLVIRYTQAGALDGSFGTGGIARIDTGPVDIGLDIALQPDGKPVIAGLRRVAGINDAFLLLRLTTGGALDGTFGTGGSTTVDVTPGPDRANGIAVQADGRIVIGGVADNGGAANAAFARFDAGGTLDTSFGVGGVTTIDAGSSEWLSRIDVQQDGRIVSAGRSASSALVVRLLASGAPDPAWGAGAGYVLRQVAGASTGTTGVEATASGAVLVAGSTNGDAFIGRLDTSGAWDPTFGSAGARTFDIGGAEFLSDLWTQPDGRVLAVGGVNGGVDDDWFLGRVTANGALDPAFGVAGVQRTDPGGLDAEAYGGAFGHDGSAYVVGRVDLGGSSRDVLVGRFAGLSVPDHGGGATWGSAGGMFGVCLATVSGTGAAAAWPPAGGGGCAATDAGGFWRSVADVPVVIASSTTSTTTNVGANLHFGMRAGSAQPPGSYVAPVTFDVVAPAI